MPRFDPIRNKYFSAIERTNVSIGALFYLGAILSLLLLLVDRQRYPDGYDILLGAFAINVLVLFLVGLVLRLYLVPRAEEKRRQDFFSSACRVALTHERTEGYYNNDFTRPMKRIAAQVLENSHFSKSIASEMVRMERTKFAVYVIIWLVCVVNRQTELGVVVAASQAIFSEEIISRWVRLEWMRTKFERTYQEVYRLFQTRPSATTFNAVTLDVLTMYETTKASGAVTLSSRVFERLNPKLSEEWTAIKAALGI